MSQAKKGTDSNQEPNKDDFSGIWGSLGLNNVSIESTTFSRSLELKTDEPLDAHSYSSLPTLTESTNSTALPELEMGEVIGKGAMGIIRKAWQISLKREVAVKSIRKMVDPLEATNKLMRESIVTGHLEHPNIIPIYMLGKDSDGSPILVMKKIEGVAWKEVLKNPDHSIRNNDKRDFLVWNLHMLMRVCNAIQYAHSKQVIHRDIKPENIMFGPFGEIYVMDWGLAVSLSKEVTELPSPYPETGIVGTPSYMAPEMLSPGGKQLCLQTDVYLLGALLFEILTGNPPHQGNNLYSVLFEVHKNGPFAFPPETAKELKDICCKALSSRPQDRFQTVEEFKNKLLDYLEFRSSRKLEELGWKELGLLQNLSAETEKYEEKTARKINELFRNSQMYFQQALQTWPENENAHNGMELAVWHRADFELRFGEYLTAWQFINQIKGDSSDLRSRLAVWQKDKEEEKSKLKELEQIHKERDPQIGAQSRTSLTWLLSIFWSVAPLLVSLLRKKTSFEITPLFQLTVATLFVCLSFSFALFWKKDLLENKFNRNVVRAVFVASLANFFLNVIAMALKLPMETLITLLLLVFAVIVAMLASGMDKKLWFPSSLYWMMCLLSIQWPLYALEWLAIGNFISLGSIALLWRQDLQTHTPA